jgi:tRNA(Ile)-lysidine synthase
MRSTLPAFDEVWQCEFRKRLITELSQFQPSAKIILGCSGGMDSMLLLALLSELIPQQLQVINIDHQLQAESAQWSMLVQHYCQQQAIPCKIVAVTVPQGNLEAQARLQRYQVFTQALRPDDVLVLAHHQQDQAETVLLRLLQGTGVQGLSAMRALERRPLNVQPENLAPTALDRISSPHYWLWRPLLVLSKAQIRHWVQQLHLPYVDDPMNHQPEYDRVWCRQQLWPLLEARFGKMQNNIARCARLMQDGQDILAEVLQRDWRACIDAQGRLQLAPYRQLSEARQRQLISAWMQGELTYRPSWSMVQHLQQQVIAARQDAQARLEYQQVCFVRFADHLYRYPQATWAKLCQPPETHRLCLAAQPSVALRLGTLSVVWGEFGLDPALLQQQLQLVPRQGGEKILFWQRSGRRVLKKMLQQANIAPWFRHQTQILMYHDVVLGVLGAQGFWLADSPYVQQQGWLPQLEMDG